jgi:hypothetical protein
MRVLGFEVIVDSRKQKTLDGLVSNEWLLSHIPEDAHSMFVPLLENFGLAMRINDRIYVPALVPEVNFLYFFGLTFPGEIISVLRF